ncbi:phosphoserine phosphatase [Plasmopara halstedii]|uniref:phosphoserine phosphatase n=1 Tax=Plasmopara halstedii TaxID=4781 RepID=A0A0N7L3G6_PLAHL|nr:phosphoserine phosphatase [Plasmopara halstedii]CEG35819.1 phosphoserine phosphatase [Plasmopara halstedii]|eukprot:XP_024572188.1 phosphoserine phosphatase [Plasmopara halstedii]
MHAHLLTKFARSVAATPQTRSLSVLKHFKSPTQPLTASDIWRSVGGVCFDVDSTVCMDEGIDVLAEHCGAGQAVKEWTSKAMNGNVKFEDALAARLNIIQPSRQDIQDCLEQHPPMFTPGIRKLVATLKNKKIDVFLVSGGFRVMIEPIAEELDIPLSNVYANTIFFDNDGNYNGFDDTELTSRDGGKAQAIDIIKRIHGFEKIAMVGDGVTDLQARPPADLIVGFGGIVTREIVKKEADLFVTDFDHLTKLLHF